MLPQRESTLYGKLTAQCYEHVSCARVLEAALAAEKLPRVSDPLYSADPVVVSEGPLAPGESAEWSFEYAVTQADVDAGQVRNIATASARPPTGLYLVSRRNRRTLGLSV